MSRVIASRHVEAAAPWRALVVAGGLGRAQRAYVEDGLRLRFVVTYVDTFDQLEAGLEDAASCDVLVVPPQDTRGRSAEPVIERVVRHWPRTGIVVFFPANTDGMPAAVTLVRAGAHELVYEGVHPTAAKLALAVENARRYVAASAIYEQLEPLVPGPVRSMVVAVLSRPEQVTGVEQLAASLSVHRKTLFNRCQRTGFLQPAALITWCRLGMVAMLLDRTGATIESIAITLGYPSHSALRNTVKRYLGCTASEARGRGAVPLMLNAFARRIGSRTLHIQ